MEKVDFFFFSVAITRELDYYVAFILTFARIVVIIDQFDFISVFLHEK